MNAVRKETCPEMYFTREVFKFLLPAPDSPRGGGGENASTSMILYISPTYYNRQFLSVHYLGREHNNIFRDSVERIIPRKF